MKNKNYILGFLLIALGFIWFFDNLGWFDFEWHYFMGGIVDLWPLILVAIGINLLLKNKTLQKLIWLLFLIGLIGYSLFMQYTDSTNLPKDFHENQNYSVTMDDGVRKGTMDLDVGGMKLNVTSGSSSLASFESNLQNMDYDTNTNGDEQILHISNSDKFFDSLNEDSTMNFEMNINEEIPWNFDLDCGAIDGQLNLKNISVEKFDLDMGAGKMDVNFGSEAKLSEVNIDSGVSQIILNLPKESGVKVVFDGALNSTNLSELDLEENDNNFISKNYKTASSLYNINVNMGLGEFKIYYY